MATRVPSQGGYQSGVSWLAHRERFPHVISPFNTDLTACSVARTPNHTKGRCVVNSLEGMQEEAEGELRMTGDLTTLRACFLT